MTDMDLADIDIVAAMDSLVPPQTAGDDDDLVMHDDIALHHHSEDPSATAPDVVSLTSKDYRLTGRPSIPLYLSCDPDTFSDFQVLVRKNVELFEAREEDIASNAQGRNKPINLGQVGIRCTHCAGLPPRERVRGAQYYPSKLEGLYQAAQNLANGHLLDGCPLIPAPLREELIQLKAKKSSAGGGKAAWAERVHALGVYEDDCGLRFADRLDAFASKHGHV